MSKHFAFISYAHKNKIQVQPLIQFLENEGYKIWYDKHIGIGNSWNDDIAVNIEQCNVFIAFISKDYISSDVCQQEFQYARTNNRYILPIRLEEEKMSPGMEMYLSFHQYVPWYNLTKEEFIARIIEEPHVLECKTEKKKGNGESECETIHLKDGGIYTGFRKDGQFHGQGKLIWSNGSVYEGEWMNGKMHGEGKITWSSSEWYEGQFFQGKIEGFGRFYWVNGDVYEGEFRNGVIDGIGRKRCKNGDIYEGSWKNALQEGYGLQRYADGREERGQWRKGKLVSKDNE